MKETRNENEIKEGKVKSAEQRLNLSRSWHTESTLMLTIPCSLIKSSTNDLSFSIFALVIERRKA
jgi:hypothetical protein